MRKLRRSGLVAVPVLLAAAALTACGPRQPWSNALVSVNADGTGSGNGMSGNPTFSPDGTKVAFASYADDLGPTDTQRHIDVYVRDLVAGTTTLVSANAAGNDSGNGLSLFPVFSPDGTKVAFSSEADDLGPTDTNDDEDLYVRDLASGMTTLVTANAAGTDSGNGETSIVDSGNPVFSSDGTKLVFGSFASDLIPTDTNGTLDVFVRDLAAGTTTLASANAAGDDSGDNWSAQPTFSPDGTKVAFISAATDLGPAGTSDQGNVFVRDLASGTTTLVSVNAAGTGGGNGPSSLAPPLFSPDGTKVVFSSAATDLGPADSTTGFEGTDVYLRDLLAGTTTLVSVNADGTDGGNGYSGWRGLAFSPDGTKLTFDSAASNLGPTDTNGAEDIYLRDLVAGTTTLLTVDADGTGSAPGGVGDYAYGVAFSPDGSKAAFTAAASLTHVDVHGISSVYVRDLVHETTTLVSADPSGNEAAGRRSRIEVLRSPPGVFSPDGRRLVFSSDASNIDPLDQDDPEDPVDPWNPDVFVATLRGADLSIEGEVEPDPVEPGATLTYRFEVTNDGPDGAEEAAVGFLLPPGTSAADVRTSQGECGAPTGSRSLVACELGDVPVDGTAELTLWANSDAPPGAEITVLAVVSSEDTADPVHRNNTIHLTTTVSGS